MRIAYVCADSGVALSKHNGSAAHLRAVVEAFRELGHDVELLLADGTGAEVLEIPVRTIQRAAFVGALHGLSRKPSAERDASTRSLLRALRRIWSNSAVEQTLTAQLVTRSPDLVYERHSPFSVAGAITARRLSCPHVLEVNAPLAWEGARHRGQALGEVAELLERSAFAATSRIVAVSDELRDQLVADGVAEEKIRVVPNGVDVRRFTPQGPTAGRIPADAFVVGFVGSLKPWHGVDVLARAFATLAEEREPYLLVVGDGPEIADLDALERRAPGRVIRTGAVPPEEVPAYLRRMQVAVAPYPRLDRFYFSPLKILEYMASGCAVVASAIGQPRRLIRDGETGLLVEPGSEAGLVRAVRRLRDEPTLRERLGRNARAEVEQHHTWRHRASEILELVRMAA